MTIHSRASYQVTWFVCGRLRSWCNRQTKAVSLANVRSVKQGKVLSDDPRQCTLQWFRHTTPAAMRSAGAAESRGKKSGIAEKFSGNLGRCGWGNSRTARTQVPIAKTNSGGSGCGLLPVASRAGAGVDRSLVDSGFCQICPRVTF